VEIERTKFNLENRLNFIRINSRNELNRKADISITLDNINADRKMFLENYFNTYSGIKKKKKLRLYDIISLHTNLFSDINTIPQKGVFRLTTKTILTKTGEFFTTEPENIVNEMEKLLSWMNNVDDINPILVSGIVMREVYRIYPFLHGSEVIARMLVYRILSINGLHDIVNIEKELLRTRDYIEYIYLREEFDSMGKWIRIYIDIIKSALQNSLKEIDSRKKFSTPLNERQKKCLEAMKDLKMMNNRTYRQLFDVGKSQAYKDLEDMNRRGLIVSLGGGRSIIYLLKNDLQ